MKINPCWAFQLKELADGGGWEWGRQGKGALFCKWGQKPTETSAVADELSHTLHPILSRDHLCYPTWQQRPHPTPRPLPWQCETLLHQGEMASKEFGLMATISCGTPLVKVWLSENTTLSLSRSLSFESVPYLYCLFLEGSRPSSTAGIVLRTFCDTHPPSSLAPSPSLCLFHTHTHTHTHSHTHIHTLSRALLLTCSSETVSFHKVPARLALPGTVDAVSHVNLELETDVEHCC